MNKASKNINNKKQKESENQKLMLYKLQTFPIKANIYIDLLNYLQDFLDTKIFWNLKKAYTEFTFFLKKLKQANLEPIFFIDGFRKTEEAKKKYFDRRKDEILNPAKKMLPHCVLFIYEICKKLNLQIHISTHHDNDDTIASYANFNNNSKMKSYILSHDRDFYRYIGNTCTIFNWYEYYCKKSNSTEKEHIKYPESEYKICFNSTKTIHKWHKDTSLRKLYNPLPKTVNNLSDVLLEPDFDNVFKYFDSPGRNYLLYESSPTYLTHIFGNPYLEMLPLIFASIFKLGYTKEDRIMFILPNYNSVTKEFEWYKEIHYVNDNLKDLEMLNDWEKTYDELFPEEKLAVYRKKALVNKVTSVEWGDFIFCLRSTVCYICSWFRSDLFVYEELIKKNYLSSELTGYNMLSVDSILKIHDIDTDDSLYIREAPNSVSLKSIISNETNTNMYSDINVKNRITKIKIEDSDGFEGYESDF